MITYFKRDEEPTGVSVARAALRSDLMAGAQLDSDDLTNCRTAATEKTSVYLKIVCNNKKMSR